MRLKLPIRNERCVVQHLGVLEKLATDAPIVIY
jgi:hypothetical protein